MPRDPAPRFKKRLNYTWHRCRRSLKSRRDPVAFAREQNNQQGLRQLAGTGPIDLFYFDGAGFNTLPSIPYAWQAAGTVRELPSFPSGRLNVLGFLSRDNRAFFHTVTGKVGSQQVIEALDSFAVWRGNTTPCIVVLDNAPWHTSQAIQNHRDAWASKGLVLHYLPPYSPELNLIEILWRKIKYDWLPLSCYTSFDHLKASLMTLLDSIGPDSDYQITFV